ncbi:inner centromere protein-like isoform X2 [Anolis carolinensis]|uniref:inner centromere protein-like isoform X2 n=1 Tax=Anolis carolinensis TaxID=28377 RepID=UPI002F2B80AD
MPRPVRERKQSYKCSVDDLPSVQNMQDENNSSHKTTSSRANKIIRPFKNFFQKNQLLKPSGSPVNNSVKHSTPTRPPTKEKQRRRLESLRKKQEAEQQRKQKVEEEKRRRLEEIKLKREERLRKALQARERVEQMEEEKKKRLGQKLSQQEEKSEKHAIETMRTTPNSQKASMTANLQAQEDQQKGEHKVGSPEKTEEIRKPSQNVGLSKRNGNQASLQHEKDLTIFAENISPCCRVTRSRAARSARTSENSVKKPTVPLAKGRIALVEISANERHSAELHFKKTPPPEKKVSLSIPLSSQETSTNREQPLSRVSFIVILATPEAQIKKKGRGAYKLKIANGSIAKTTKIKEPITDEKTACAQQQENCQPSDMEVKLYLSEDPWTPRVPKEKRQSVRRSLMGRPSLKRRSTFLVARCSLSAKRKRAVQKSMLKRKASQQSSSASGHPSSPAAVHSEDEETSTESTSELDPSSDSQGHAIETMRTTPNSQKASMTANLQAQEDQQKGEHKVGSPEKTEEIRKPSQNVGLSKRNGNQASLQHEKDLTIFAENISPCCRVTRSRAARSARTSENSVKKPTVPLAKGRIALVEISANERHSAELHFKKTPPPEKKVSLSIPLSSQETSTNREQPLSRVSFIVILATPEAQIKKKGRGAYKLKIANGSIAKTTKIKEPITDEKTACAQQQENCQPSDMEVKLYLSEDPWTPRVPKEKRQSVRRSLMGRPSLKRRSTFLVARCSLSAKRKRAVQKSMLKRKASQQSSSASGHPSSPAAVHSEDEETSTESTSELDPSSDSQGNSPCNSYEMTPQSHKHPKVNIDDYGMDLNSDDSTDDESQPRKPIPAWASGNQLTQAVMHQYYNPSNVRRLFGVVKCPNLEEIFYKSKPRYFKRTSSAFWNSPPFPDCII